MYHISHQGYPFAANTVLVQITPQYPQVVSAPKQKPQLIWTIQMAKISNRADLALSVLEKPPSSCGGHKPLRNGPLRDFPVWKKKNDFCTAERFHCNL